MTVFAGDFMYIRPERRAYHFIYKISRDDGAFYIGLHSTDNLDDGYFGSGRRLWLSIKKYGRNKHAKTILEFCESRKALELREAELVTAETLARPQCLNLALGGRVATMTDETRRKISEAKRGKLATEATRLQMSIARRGIPKTDDHRAAISKAHSGKNGIPHTQATKEKLSRAGLGRPCSEEAKKKLSMKLLGVPRNRLTCPHCGKDGGNSNMKRYHFENCRQQT
jgi:hypothetical protein